MLNYREWLIREYNECKIDLNYLPNKITKKYLKAVPISEYHEYLRLQIDLYTEEYNYIYLNDSYNLYKEYINIEKVKQNIKGF